MKWGGWIQLVLLLKSFQAPGPAAVTTTIYKQLVYLPTSQTNHTYIRIILILHLLQPKIEMPTLFTKCVATHKKVQRHKLLKSSGATKN